MAPAKCAGEIKANMIVSRGRTQKAAEMLLWVHHLPLDAGNRFCVTMPPKNPRLKPSILRIGFANMIHRAKDLSPDQKLLIERLLGRRVLEDEAISVRAFEPASIPDERRREIADELRKYFAEVDANRRPATPDEAEEVITEAIRSTRPSYRPHQ
jgi:hypothetical protein